MSGYISPAGDAEGGLPDGGLLAGGLPERGLPEAGLPGVYINPDNLPTVNTSHIENDYDEHYDDHYDVAPARGTIGKTAKLVGTFKKSGKNNMDPPGPPRGVSQLGDDLGKTGGSSACARDDISRGIGSRHDGSRRHHASKTSHGATKDSMRTTVRNFFSGHSYPFALPVSTADAEVAPLKPAPRRSPTCRISVGMFAMFVLMVISGIIMLIIGYTKDSVAAKHCKFIGPAFMVLGCFLIIAEVFFMRF